MKALGVNRVTLAVEDVDEAVGFYTKLLGATFHDQDRSSKSLGIRCAISWDAGIELLSPIPGCRTYWTELIEKRGYGLLSVVLAVDDVEACRRNAEEMNVRVYPLVDCSPRDIEKYLQNRFKKYKEYVLDPADTFGVGPVIGQIEPR